MHPNSAPLDHPKCGPALTTCSWAIAAIVILIAWLAPTVQAAVTINVSSSFVHVATDGGGGGYEAFPDVTRLNDGRLMTVFYEGYTHISLPNTSYPNGGRIMYATSSNEGANWSAPSVLYDGPQDDRDPSITQLPSGELLCSFFTYSSSGGQGTWLVRSNSAGATWSSPELLAANPYYVSSPIYRLSSGRLVQGLYYEDDAARVAHGAVTVSDTGGAAWSSPIDIPNHTGLMLDAETSVIQLKNGSLWAAERSSGNPLHYATSTDGGNTWSESQPLSFRADSPYLLRTHGSMILLSYRGYDASGTQFTALRYSLDEAATWSDPITIDTVNGAYPSMVNLNDGSALVVYYEEGAGSNIRARVIDITGVPEPGTFVLLATALTGLMGYAWRKRRQVAVNRCEQTNRSKS